jgi:hypothetical protein
MQKMNLTDYMISSYSNITELLTTQKQSQNKPKQTQFYLAGRVLKAKANPILVRRNISEGGSTLPPFKSFPDILFF